MATSRPNIGINIAGPDKLAIQEATKAIATILEAASGNDQTTIQKALDVFAGMTNKPVSITDSSVSMGH